MLINQKPIKVYGFQTSVFYGLWNALLELLGLTHIVQQMASQSILGTWWYMGAALAFILLLPTVAFLLSNIGPAGTLGLVFLLPRVLRQYPGNCSFYSFFPIFCIGSVFAKYEVFQHIDGFFATKKPFAGKMTKLLLFLLLTVLAYKTYYFLDEKIWWDFKFCILPIPLILLMVDICKLIKPLKTALAFLGKHSVNIYLIHNFIRIYAPELVYGRGHFIVVYAVLLCGALIVSFCVEKLKKVTRYELLINKLYAKGTTNQQLN